MLSLYSEEPFVKRINRLLDNNKLLWGQKKKIGNKEIDISSPDVIKNQGNRHILMIITSDRYVEIYSQQFRALSEAGMKCIRYPICYYSYLNVLLLLCRLVPMRRQILFNSGDEPHENTKALVDYMENKYDGKRYRLVFVEDMEKVSEKNIRHVFIYRNTLKIQSKFINNLRHCFYMATSKYIFYENEPLHKVRRGQVLIYLNHGTIPLKNVKDVLEQPKEMDYALCPSDGCAEIYERQYAIPKNKQWYIMLPRTVYLTEKVQRLNKIVEYGTRQVIIWLPTFRALKGTDRQDSKAENILPLMADENNFLIIDRELGKNGQLLIIKTHPRERFELNIPVVCENIKMISEEDLREKELILQEILADTSALLTDYSGICFEYLLLDKPIGYVVNDINDYTRGFAFDDPWDYMPGEKINTIKGLINFFDDIRAERDNYRKERELIKEEIFRGNEMKNGAEELIKQLEAKG